MKIANLIESTIVSFAIILFTLFVLVTLTPHAYAISGTSNATGVSPDVRDIRQKLDVRNTKPPADADQEKVFDNHFYNLTRESRHNEENGEDTKVRGDDKNSHLLVNDNNYRDGTSSPETFEERRQEIRDRLEERKIEISEKKEEIKSRLEERKADLKDKAVERIRAYIDRTQNRFEAAIDRLEHISERILSRIEKLEEKELDMTNSRALLGTAENDLLTAREAVNLFVNEAYTALENEDDPRATFATIREILNDAKNSLKDAHASLVDAIISIKSLGNEGEEKANEGE